MFNFAFEKSLFRILFSIFIINQACLADSKPIKVLYLKDLEKESITNSGINAGGVYFSKDASHQKFYVKDLFEDRKTYNSLILSYQTSLLINMICPGQGPIVIPAVDSGAIMIASYDMPSFQGGDKGERYALLHLVLDFFDITDRHAGNIGTVLLDGKRVSAVVDVDMYEGFVDDWFTGLGKYTGDKAEFLSALESISSFSDEKIIATYNAGIHMLEEVMGLKSLKQFYNVDHLLEKALYRKHQMEWVKKHFTTVFDYLESHKLNALKKEELIDDKFGFFLKIAVEQNDGSLFNDLIHYGAKDPEGWALESAAKLDMNYMYDALIKNGARDPNGRVLSNLVRKRNDKRVRELVEAGSKDPHGLAIAAAIIESVAGRKTKRAIDEVIDFLLDSKVSSDPNGRALAACITRSQFALFHKLLSLGAEDSSGLALVEAIKKNNMEIFQLLIDYGANDPNGNALIAAIENNRPKMFDLILKRHLKTSSSSALVSAVEKESLSMVKALVDNGARDSRGVALAQAVKRKKIEIVQFLIDHGAKDPERKALKAAEETNDVEIYRLLKILHK